jgi:hypothetical protein
LCPFDQALRAVGGLIVRGLIVLIRTLLSFSLEVEIGGRWPWRRAALERAASLPASPASSEPGGS